MAELERGEPVNLLRVRYTCRARWRTGPAGGAWEKFIRAGELDDGRWFVELASQVSGARAYSSREAAWTVVQNLMQAFPSEWTRLPCYPTHGWQPGEEPSTVIE